MKGNVLILGGNSDIAKAIALQFSENGYRVTNAVRNPEKPDELVFDAVDFESHSSFVAELQTIPDVVVVSFGILPNSEECFNQPEIAVKSTLVNYTGVVSVLGELTKLMAQRGSGTIIGISSVAGERGRASNYVYGSAKAGMTIYLDGLRNFLFDKGIHVITVKPGFVDTKMTKDLMLPKWLTASPEKVAESVYKAFNTKSNSVYVLPIWRCIMLSISLIPEFIFKRMKL